MASMIGCKTPTPFACAIAPTTNGKTAPPVPPNAVLNPTLGTCRCPGNSFVAIMIPLGKTGPRNTPRNATAIALARMLGTSQKRSCKPMAQLR
ncbi:hypothetical protein PMZ80_005460 [Knufia obscura]|uniref:Uncharacterized protein n=1 Tax=Knufia obscura TaxID=1635080 RepID=A0ABR0RS64_9EURO|nr:hypothetical protein PMZ80_005460 [Knufia obscura]